MLASLPLVHVILARAARNQGAIASLFLAVGDKSQNCVTAHIPRNKIKSKCGTASAKEYLREVMCASE
jgi:hypothetical protein